MNKNRYLLLLLPTLLIAELAILHLLNNAVVWEWLTYIHAVALFLLSVWIACRKKMDEFRLVTSIAFLGVGGSLVTLSYLFYFILHMSWIADALREFIWNDASFGEVAWHTAYLILPVLIHVAFIRKEKADPNNKNKRKVLITGLSLLDSNTTPYQKAFGVKGIEQVEALKNAIKNNQDITAIDTRWQPIFKTLKTHESIDELILLVSKDTEFEERQLKDKQEWNNCTFEKITQINFPAVKLHKLTLENPYLVEPIVEHVRAELNIRCRKRKDVELLFGITGGTAPISSALSMLAVKGARGITYVSQDSSKTVLDEEINVFTVKDLWQELIDKAEK